MTKLGVMPNRYGQPMITKNDHPTWNAHEYDIKKALGLPKKLGPAPTTIEYLGEVAGIKIYDFPQRPGRRCHRLRARIGIQFVPVGRLHQYRGYYPSDRVN